MTGYVSGIEKFGIRNRSQERYGPARSGTRPARVQGESEEADRGRCCRQSWPKSQKRGGEGKNLIVLRKIFHILLCMTVLKHFSHQFRGNHGQREPHASPDAPPPRPGAQLQLRPSEEAPPFLSIILTCFLTYCLGHQLVEKVLFCYMFSASSPCLLGQHGSCGTVLWNSQKTFQMPFLQVAAPECSRHRLGVPAPPPRGRQ